MHGGCTATAVDSLMGMVAYKVRGYSAAFIQLHYQLPSAQIMLVGHREIRSDCQLGRQLSQDCANREHGAAPCSHVFGTDGEGQVKIEAWVERVEGRKVFIAFEVWSLDGASRHNDGTALFIDSQKARAPGEASWSSAPSRSKPM